MGFNDTPLAQESEQSQRAPDTTPTASEQKQQTEQTVKEQTPDALAAAKAEVRTQLLTTDYQAVPTDRIDALVAAKMAWVVTKGTIYVYFVSVEGNQIVRYILAEEPRGEEPYTGGYPVPDGWYMATHPGATPYVYKVVWQQLTKLGSGAATINEVLAAWDTQREANLQVDAYLSRAARGQAQMILGTINFVVHATPFLGTADYAAQGMYWEATLSAAGDASLLLTAGFSKVVTTSATTARNLRITAMGIEGVAGVARTGQGFFALSNGDKEDAAGYFGEAMLRFLGVSASAIAELKAAQKARAALVAEAAPNGNSGGLADDLIDRPNSPNGLQNMMPSLGRLRPPVTAKDVVISYAHGQPGKNAVVDNIASVLQDVTVAET
ncbi:MAG: hypothetical protein ACREHD_19015, partial [Pirellulales bacterium]